MVLEQGLGIGFKPRDQAENLIVDVDVVHPVVVLEYLAEVAGAAPDDAIIGFAEGQTGDARKSPFPAFDRISDRNR